MLIFSIKSLPLPLQVTVNAIISPGTMDGDACVSNFCYDESTLQDFRCV